MKNLWTIRTQLFLLALAVAAPLVALAAFYIIQNWNQSRTEALSETLSTARLISTRIDDHVQTVDTLLQAVGALVGDRLGEVDSNDARLRALQGSLPRYFSSVSVLTPEGRMLNSSTTTRQEREKLDLSDRDYFLQALAQPGLALGTPVVSRTSGRWIIVAARSLRAADGSVRAIVSTSTLLERFQDMVVPADLPPGSVMTVLDERGIVVARSMDPLKWVGADLSASPNLGRARSARELSDETMAADGVRRLAGYATPRLVPWTVYVGIPSEVALSRARAQLAWLVGFATLAIAAAAALAYLLGRRLSQPIEAIAESAQRVAAGRFDARAELSGTREIAYVAREFNSMLETIASSQVALRESQARLRNVLDNMFPFVGLLSPEGLVLEVNRTPLEAAGLAPVDVLGKSCEETAWFSYSIEVRKRLRAALARAAAGEMARYDEHIQVAGGRLMAIDLMFSPLRDTEGRVCGIVGSAVDITDRKQAEDTLRESATRLRDLSRRLMETEETERRALNRELHDRIGQNLSALGLNLGLLRVKMQADVPAAIGARLDDMEKLVETTSRDIRNLMAELRPPALDDYGLVAALSIHAGMVSERSGVAVRLRGKDLSPRPAAAVETAMFRIAQEALNNAIKHARAGGVEIEVVSAADGLRLIVSDDGAGFSDDAVSGRTTWGMSTMRERAEAIGAMLRVDSAPGRGTRIMVEISGTSPAVLAQAEAPR
jgi:two-component system sensor histidine kinase UhpB